MANNTNPSSGNEPGRVRFPLTKRTMGILVMVAGAAAFFYSRIQFEDNLLCLGGSTLIVFAGLAIILTGRRTGGGSTQEQAQGMERMHEPGPVFRRRMPRGLHQEALRKTRAQPPAIASSQVKPVPPAMDVIPVVQSSSSGEGSSVLLDQVIAYLGEQGARVAIETQRDDADGSRGILQVHSQDGLPYTFLVLEGPDPVDVADVRALYALVNSSGSTAGYLIASAPFSQRAYEWAGARHIHLVREDELGEMSL